MGSLLVELVPFAAGLAVTPKAIATGILFLSSKRPLGNAIAFSPRSPSSTPGWPRSCSASPRGDRGGEPEYPDPARRAGHHRRRRRLHRRPGRRGGAATGRLPARPDGPILWYVARPASAGRSLARARGWLARHKRPVDLGVLVVFGLLFTASGLRGL